jgi:choline transport protein
MIAVMALPIICNLWFRKILNTFETIGGLLHIILFVVFIAILAALGPRSKSDFVFKTLTSDVSGWNNPGVSWGLGLLSMTFSVTGADSVLHMCDEVKHVRTRVPRSIILTCVVNSIMLITFATVLLFYLGPLEDAMETPLPILWVIYGATGSKTVSNVLMALMAIIFFLAAFNIFASVSRLVWVFAKDNGLPFSSFFARIHPGLHLPLNALLLVATVVICLSLVYIASATAFNALISLQALALHVSYFFPILFILIRKLRGPKPAYGPFTMGKIGVGVNIFALCYLIYVVLWMPFPQILPVTKDNMNYAGPIFAAMLLGALSHWFLSGKRTFQMPVA